jgi:hypothetical protein
LLMGLEPLRLICNQLVAVIDWLER